MSAGIGRRTQPWNASGPACVDLEVLLLTRFTPREIQVIRTWQATHVEYLFTVAYDLHQRGVALLDGCMAGLAPAPADRRVAAR